MYVYNENNSKSIDGTNNNLINKEYCDLSIQKLIEKITLNHDQKVLNHLLSYRKVIQFEGKRMIIPHYIQELRKKEFYPYIKPWYNEEHLEEKLDLTYDRTIQKFCVLNSNSNNFEGPFCNRQYEVIYNKLDELGNSNQNYGQIQNEMNAEKIIKSTIIRHIKYSWLEVCRRTNRVYKRYRWELPSGTIELKKPLGIEAREFRKWLEKNIIDPKPELKNEKYRIQREIDGWFGHSAEVDYQELENKIFQNEKLILDGEYPEDFISLISTEKSESIDKLRPAVRALGKIKVKELVGKILIAIMNDENNDNSIAKEYKLSKATYSRFAGRKWEEGPIINIPDLWANIASIVVRDPVVMELAISLGLKSVIQAIMEVNGKVKR